jgi:hypothetical protein
LALATAAAAAALAAAAGAAAAQSSSTIVGRILEFVWEWMIYKPSVFVDHLFL